MGNRVPSPADTMGNIQLNRKGSGMVVNKDEMYILHLMYQDLA
jgi:hypothetical protein